MNQKQVEDLLGKPSWSVKVSSWNWTSFYGDGRTDPIAVEFGGRTVTSKTWQDDDSFLFRILRAWLWI